jgi:uncharacterized repeat protein (TIGR03943 family)
MKLMAKTSTACRWVNYLDGLAMLAWGILLVKLWLTNQLLILIHPNYVLLAVLATLGLLVIGVAELRRKNKKNNFSWGSAVLLGTALIALLVPPRAFASDKAIHRSVEDFGSLHARLSPQSFRGSNRPEQRTLLEWVRTLAAYPEPDAYAGQPAKVTGFVVKSEDLPAGVFLLTRFVITCCAADVYPVSLPVKSETQEWQNDRWLAVEGKMFTLEIAGSRKLAIAAEKITPIPEPPNPYL